ncbi:MAG: PilX N-terminal domain-containing pilus assembly protein [Thermomonas sp.]
MNMQRNPNLVPSRQRGISLVVVLILLVVMTLIGILSLRSGILQERMAGGAYDRSLSFEATEQALRVAEKRIKDYSGNFTDLFPGTGCTNSGAGAGLCARPTANQADRWAGISCTEGAPWQQVTGVSTNAQVPRYIIELMGPVPPPWNPGCGKNPNDKCQMLDTYRVTACSGDPANGRAMTILQTTFIKG